MDDSQYDKEWKLEILLDEYGLTGDEFLDRYVTDSVIPGICMNSHCQYIAEYEPDQSHGWCEVCGTETVCSGLILFNIL